MESFNNFRIRRIIRSGNGFRTRSGEDEDSSIHGNFHPQQHYRDEVPADDDDDAILRRLLCQVTPIYRKQT